MTLRFLSEGLAVAITQHSGRCCSPLSPDTPQDARVPRDPRRAGLAPPTSGLCRLTGPVDGVLTTVPGLEVQAGRQFSPCHPEPAVCGPPGRSGGPTRGCGQGVEAAAIVRGSGGQRAVSPGGGGSAHTWTWGPARGSAGLPGPVGHVSAQPGLDRRTRRVPEPLERESHMSPKRRRENNFEEWKRNPTCPKAWGSCSEGICGVGVGQGGGHRRSTAQASAFGLGENEAT